MDDRPQPPADASPPPAGPETMPGEGPPVDEVGPPPQQAPSRHEAVAATGQWQLRRSVRDRKLKGVAGGVAAAADVDVTLVRLLFAVAALSGWGLVAYVVLAVVLPDETVEDPARTLARDQRRMLRIGLGVAAFVAVGRLFGGWFTPGGDMGLPLLLIAVGAAVLWARRDQRPLDPAGPEAPVAPLGGDPLSDLPGPGLPPSWPITSATPPLGAGIDWRSTGHDLLRLAAAFVAVGALLALLGTAFLVVVGAVPMRVPLLPAAVAVAGLLGLVVAVVRRVRPAALFISGGVLLAAAALAVGLASFPHGAGNRVVTVGPGSPLLGHYQHGAGTLLLDLAALTLEPGSERRVVADVGAGQLTVIVPPQLTTRITARIGAGNTTLFGQTRSGPGVDVGANHVGEPEAGRLDLDLDVGVGQINVELAGEPTFEVSCTVPVDAKGDGTDAVTCPHPPRLAASAMSCSVELVSLEGARAGGAFCRRSGSPAPVIARMAAACSVPAGSDAATCAQLPPERLREIEQRRTGAPSSPPPAAMSTTSSLAPAGPPSAVPAPAPGASQLSCGPPDATGARSCTSSYRCTEDPATSRLTCIPA